MEFSLPQRDLSNFRNSYEKQSIDFEHASNNPFDFFDYWFQNALDFYQTTKEVNAMTLSTSSLQGVVSSRMVLLKSFSNEGFVFYTNYESKKGIHLSENPNCSMLFYWEELQQQIRIEGFAEKVSTELSDAYFDSRPADSRLSAIVSPQSKVIPDKAFLNKELEKNQNIELKRPDFWGGFLIKPNLFEFWQGRPNRLHDRLQYRMVDSNWVKVVLAP